MEAGNGREPGTGSEAGNGREVLEPEPEAMPPDATPKAGVTPVPDTRGRPRETEAASKVSLVVVVLLFVPFAVAYSIGTSPLVCPLLSTLPLSVQF